MEGQSILEQLYSKDWFGENARREVYVRYYSMPFQPKADFYIPGLDGNVVVYADTVFKVGVAHIADQKYLSHIPWLVQSRADNNKVIVEKLERILPETDYVLVTTPIRGVGDQAYLDASVKMDGFVGILRLVGGNNLLRQLVREGTVDVSTGNIKTPTSIVPVPSASEGPFATFETWEQLKEITDRGILVRDLGRGLVDFPSLRDGREIYLCWLRGEVEIAYWHPTDTGFADRRPI